jgi:hypothetical protein
MKMKLTITSDGGTVYTVLHRDNELWVRDQDLAPETLGSDAQVFGTSMLVEMPGLIQDALRWEESL